MVKLKGPALSTAAHGTVADVLTIAAAMKGNYARRKPIPAQPRTPLQLSVRAIMGFLGSEWKGITPSSKATWQPLATAAQIAPYHAFVATNAKRWNNFLAPSTEYPATEAGATPTRPLISTDTGPGYIELQLTDWNNKPDWGWSIHRSSTDSIPRDREQAVAIIDITAPPPTIWRDTGLQPGVYYYAARGFHKTGLWGIWTNTGPIILT